MSYGTLYRYGEGRYKGEPAFSARPLALPLFPDCVRALGVAAGVAVSVTTASVVSAGSQPDGIDHAALFPAASRGMTVSAAHQTAVAVFAPVVCAAEGVFGGLYPESNRIEVTA